MPFSRLFNDRGHWATIKDLKLRNIGSFCFICCNISLKFITSCSKQFDRDFFPWMSRICPAKICNLKALLHVVRYATNGYKQFPQVIQTYKFAASFWNMFKGISIFTAYFLVGKVYYCICILILIQLGILFCRLCLIPGAEVRWVKLLTVVYMRFFNRTMGQLGLQALKLLVRIS